jgi:predicted component of type VI protein secretion system
VNAFAERLLSRIEAIDRVSAENGRRTEVYAALGEELAAVTAEVTSPDGAVTVLAGAGGAITDVRFSGAIHSAQPRELSRSVLSVLSQAQAEAARKQAELVRSRLGSTEELEQVIAYDERLLGMPNR